MDDNKPPDPYAATRAFAMALERQGVPVEDIIDGLMVTAINASERLSGAEAVAMALQDIAANVAAEAAKRDAPALTVH